VKVTITEFVTLDGVSQGPGSPTEDTSDGFTRGGWLVPHLDEQFVRQACEWLDLADGLLLGRRTYQAFARDWPQITDPDDPFTERMNSLPKYVVTNTLIEGTWNPTIVLRGDAVQSVGALRSRPGRELQIHGSAASAGRCSRPVWWTRSGWSSHRRSSAPGAGCSPTRATAPASGS
jgi:dihydrofolate reductase